MKYELETRVLEEVVETVGKIILEQSGNRKFSINGREFKAEVDMLADKAGVGVIKKYFPNDTVLTEESGLEIGINSSRIWMCDLLDGTTNFLNGNPMYTVLIGFAEDGKMRAAACLEPANNRLLLAVEGFDTMCNEKEIKVIKRKLSESIVVLDPGYDPDGVVWIGENFQKIREKCGNVAMYNANGFSLACLARGEIGGMVHLASKIWEVAAIYIAQRAGAVFTDLQGKELKLDLLSQEAFPFLASNGIGHQELVELIGPVQKIR